MLNHTFTRHRISVQLRIGKNSRGGKPEARRSLLLLEEKYYSRSLKYSVELISLIYLLLTTFV